jgi:hypothetical protein
VKQLAKKTNVMEEKQILSFIKDRVDGTDMNDYKLQGYLNLAYFVGKQWITIDEKTKRLIQPERQPWQIRMVANRIQPIVRTELAKITKNKPICDVIPASNEDNDIKASKTAQKICEWLEYELSLQRCDREICLQGLTTAMGFLKPFWNKNKGQKLQDPETGEIVMSGDVDVDIVSFFDVKFDMSASTWKDVRWICFEKPRDVDEIYEIYGEKVEPEKNLVSTNAYDSKLRSLNQNWDNSNFKKYDHSAMVKEYWELPSQKFPNGRRVTIASDKVLLYVEDIGFGEEDDTIRELPFFPYIHINVPGRTIGTTVVEQLIPIQREYNKARSQVIEHKNLMAKPKWLTQEDSLVDEITDMPGEVIQYKVGFQMPIMSQPTSMGSDVYKNLEQLVEEFYFISGQQDVSHGNTANSSVKSGVAIRFLQEQDDTKLGPSIQNYIDYKNAYMSYFLKMIRYKTSIERTINIVGQDKKIEAITFKGSDITSTTVRVQEGSMFQASKSAKQQYIFDLINAGVLNAQEDKQIILKMLELGMVDSLYDDTQIDILKADEENERYKKGDTSPLTRDFYNHTLHILEHNKFRKSQDYDELPPELQQVIDAHVQEHEMYLTPQQPQMGAMGAKTPISDMMDGLTPEEQQAIVDDPTILDEYHGGK